MTSLSGDVHRLVSVLTNYSSAVPADEFPADRAAVDSAGLYSWWCDAAGLAVLSEPFDAPLPSLIYAGQAGATSRTAGVERLATLASRIGSNHLRGNISSSTFRQTLTAILREPLALRLERPGRLSSESNATVSRWMREHLRIVTAACDDRSALARLEDDVLAVIDPPLNLMGMPATPVRLRLKQLRRELRTAAG